MKLITLFLGLLPFSLLSASSPSDFFKGEDSPEYRVITPQVDYELRNDIGLFFSADYLYWTARTDGLGYVFSGFGDGSLDAIKGKLHQLNNDYESGFKADAGYRFDHDGWDIFAEYTWFFINPKKNETGTPLLPSNATVSSRLAAAWDIGAPTSMLSLSNILRAKANWDLHFHVADLEIGRNYETAPNLHLRPFFGLKGTYQIQNYRVLYEKERNNVFTSDTMTIRQETTGYGLRAGLKTTWLCGAGFSLYGNMALSGLWSQFDLSRKTKEVFTTGGTPLTLNHINNNFHTITPVIELGIGLKWAGNFYDDGYHLLIQLGWEEQVWMSQNQFTRFNEETSHGDLILQGLTAKLRIDF